MLMNYHPTVSTFTATTPENMPLTHRASTLANHDPMISLTFVEANYEIFESLLRERWKQIRNKDLCTELEYFSEMYDEEREMEPRPVRIKETTSVLCMGSFRTQRQRERVVEFEDAPNREGGRVERNSKGGRPSDLGVDGNRSQRTNLPSLLAAHLRRSKNGQPLQSSLTFVYGGHQPSTNIGGNLPPNGEPSSNTRRPFQKAGSILNYEDLKAKFRSHFSQQKKFTKTHLAVHNIKQREGESTRSFVTRYTDYTLQILDLHEDQCFSGFVHGLRIRRLVEFLSTNLTTTYKGLMEKTYT
ncbi:reverse transcriptase domain-containing protein [Tanacetum coccineum]|uniref:Reverse transcriptase domain-containing protein n=1 Tax=Tanacetum coccineum TaxID=301880 RepID=A0ABQ5DXW3_9ASTR